MLLNSGLSKVYLGHICMSDINRCNSSSLIPARKWFYSALGDDGLCKLLAAYDDKAATAVCTFAFSAGPGSEPHLFQGCTEGKIVDKRGEGGFGMFSNRLLQISGENKPDISSGFDPIFEVEGQTYAEMSFAYKVS